MNFLDKDGTTKVYISVHPRQNPVPDNDSNELANVIDLKESRG